MKFCILYLISWWCITMFSTTNLSISCHLVSNKQVLFKSWFWWFYWSFSSFLLALIVISLSPFRLLLLGYLESQNFPSTLPHSCLIIFSSEVSFLWIVIYKPLSWTKETKSEFLRLNLVVLLCHSALRNTFCCFNVTVKDSWYWEVLRCGCDLAS